MSTTLSTKKLGFTASENFKESFFEASPTIGYIFIGNHLAYPNETSPTTLTDSVFEEKAIWDNMFAAKKITGNDLELVIPKVSWTGSTKYKQFDAGFMYDTLKVTPDPSKFKDDEKIFFQFKPLIEYLNKKRFSNFTETQMGARIRDLGGDSTKRRIRKNKKLVHLWYVPEDFAERDEKELKTPNMKEQVPFA